MLFARKLVSFLGRHCCSVSPRRKCAEHVADRIPLIASTRDSLSPTGRRRRCASKRMGAATIEVAMVAPFILFLVFGSVEFGRMMMVKQSLTNAAREGCRHASLATVLNHDSAESVVRDLLDGVIVGSQDPSVVSVTITPEFHGSPSSGTEIVTLVEVDCADISWLPETLFVGAKVRGYAFMNRE